ncbi:MAG: thiamine phosphate synthase [Neptuniibacter caesariensis]|uniref:Thiamine-phosphate synthase n=1 Tax=Neptuniibacter caesariensis TaxID=207954 RepID=A0A2G6JBX0_NEPCE|nr:MAG: thiamine phosphate synthase [Neptuniibacter caesariensis]
MRHHLSGLYGITDAALMPSTALMLKKVEQSITGGAQIIQYRDKSADLEKRVEQAALLNNLCKKYNVPLLINDDAGLAAGIGAAGVHLGQSDGIVSEAREMLGAEAIIGVTCHDSIELAEQASVEGANYIAFGAFFPSKTKPAAKPAPLALIQQAKQRVDLPIVAIGGISVDNAAQIIEAGADMVAVIHALYAEKNITATARRFQQQFTNRI